MKNKTYANASIVTAFSTLERGLGFLYRVVLSHLIGAEGLGLYQISLSVFAFFLTIGTGGIPITVSRMIAKSKAQTPKIESGVLSAGLSLALLLTIPVCFFLGLFGNKLHFLFSDERCFSVFRILLIGLSFSCVYGVLKGYFWGNKNFLLPSALDLAEETVMVIVGVLLLGKVSSPASGAEKAAWAVVISYLFSFGASFLCFFFLGGKISSPKKQLKPLFNATLPITSVRASGTFITSAIAVILPAMLVRLGTSENEALKLFGMMTGMVIPVLFIPVTLIGSLALVLIPELSEDFYKKREERLRKNIQRGLKFSFAVACVLLPFFYALGEDMGKIAFSNAQAGLLIKKSCLILLPMSVTMISTSILNSLGFEKKSFLFYILSEGVMLLCILVFPAVCGIYAYVVGMGASFSLNAVLNLLYLRKKCAFLGKRRGQGRRYFYSTAVFCVLPLSLFGQFLNTLFKRFTGQIFAFCASGLCLGTMTFFLYAILGVIPLKNLLQSRKSSFRKRQKKQGFSL